MTTSQYKRYINKKMNKETTRYVDGIHSTINYIQKHHDRDKWQVDYEAYGGLSAYTVIKNLYWGRLRDKVNFPLENEFLTPDIYNLMKQFRKDLNVQLDIPAKYDKYR